MKYINTYDTTADYNNDSARLYPNVSYIKDVKEVKWASKDPTLIVAKFTTTSANQQVKISHFQQYFSSIVADGEPLTIGTGNLNHTFASAGKHIVEYKAIDATSISNTAFYQCTDLTAITIPNSVTSFGIGVFSGCAGLASITVGSGNTVYNDGNGSNCIIQTATNTLVLGCKNTVIPDSVTSIGNDAFSGCTGLTNITIPNSVTSIGDSAFYQCTGLTAVTIPNLVASIGEYAFYYCTGLTNITIPNSVTTIGNHAFSRCTGLSSVTIGNSVTAIGEYAFQSCSGLTSITSIAITPPRLDYEALQNVPATCPIYVPAESVSAYQTASRWSARAEYIQAIQ